MDVEWGDLTLVASFFAGTIVGVLLSVRLVKVLADYFRRDGDR